MKYISIVAACVVVVALGYVGCTIEESQQGLTGTAYVVMRDSTGADIERAAIWIDGQETSQRTPAYVAGLSVGTHVIGAVRSDVYETSDTVTISYNDTLEVVLEASFRPVGAVELTNAPDSTVLLLDNVPAGTTPPTLLYAGTGTHRASLFLDGHMTDYPAQWTITIAPNDTARIAPTFTPVATGHQPLELAPLFALADDRDSSIYRLQDYRGKVILLTFFFVDCAPCVAEMPHIQEVYEMEEYAGKIEFFGIDPQDFYFNFAQFRTIRHPELGLTFPLLYATQQGVREAYNVIPFPTNIFIDQTGRVRFREAGVDIDIIRNHLDALLAEASE